MEEGIHPASRRANTAETMCWQHNLTRSDVAVFELTVGNPWWYRCPIMQHAPCLDFGVGEVLASTPASGLPTGAAKQPEPLSHSAISCKQLALDICKLLCWG
jgi:hypothetical protein